MQAAFASSSASILGATAEGSRRIGGCRWPLRIVSTQRELDLTSCFEHAVMLPVPLVLVLVHSCAQIFYVRRGIRKGRVQWLDRGRIGERVGFIKLAIQHFVLLLALAALALSIPTFRHSPLSTLHYSLYLLVQLAFIPLSTLNHHTSRTSPAPILLFWPAYALLSAVRIRTLILTGHLALTSTSVHGHDHGEASTIDGRLALAREALWLASLILGFVQFSLELFSPEKHWGTTSWGARLLGAGSEGKIRLADDESSDGDEARDEVRALNGDTAGGVAHTKNEYGEVESPVVRANVYERLTFSWLTPLLSLGTRKFLGEEDMWSLPTDDSAEALSNRISLAWERQRDLVNSGRKSKASLKIAIAQAYGKPYLVAGCLKALYDALSFLQPQMLRLLLNWVSSYKTIQPMPAPAGYAISILMFVSANLATATLHQYFDRCFATTMRVKGGLVTLIYRKSLILSSGEKTGRTTGDIVNLQSVDAVRIADLAQYGHIAWSGPFQILLAFISLYNLVGWQAFMGVAVMFISLPVSTLLSKHNKTLQRRMMKIKDKRSRLMNEILNNIKSIKLYGWEKAFSEKVLSTRNSEELAMLRKIGLVQSGNQFVFQSVPFVVAFSTFATFVMTSDRPLTSEIIFPAISLFQLLWTVLMLSFPMAVFANIINSIIEATVSVGRLEDFLSADELDSRARKVILPRNDPNGEPQVGDEVVTIKNGEFRWIASSTEPILQDIDLSVKKGDLVAVIGRVGDGKSSLLGSILGEMTRSDGSVTVRGDVAYFSQTSWILSATVKDNIVFGHRFDQAFYDKVLDACALRADLAVLAAGDMTEVGEKGVSLSGGQKARICLARACYARADIYLLDDPLSAVDAHVGRHIFDRVLGPNGILKHKARILCTNAVNFLPQADQVVMLRRGIILERGTYAEAMTNSSSELYKLITGLGKQASKDQSGAATPALQIEEESDEEHSVDDGASSVEKRHVIRRLSSGMRRASVVSIKQAKRDALRDLRESAKPKEHSEKGSVKRDVYSRYIRAASRLGVALFVIFMCSGQGASILASFILRSWAGENSEKGESTKVSTYLLLYGVIGISSSFFTAASMIIFRLYCGLRSSRQLHDEAFTSLMRSPLSFFELTPTGRVLNLFSRDVFVIDEVLIQSLAGIVRMSTMILGTAVVIALGAPLVLVIFVPLGYLYRQVQIYYLATSRELKRLDAISRSPIFSFFGESLTGVSVIRGFNQSKRFIANNEARIDRNQACYMPAMTINRWLAVRLEFLGSVLMFATAMVSVSALIYSNSVDAGIVGLMMTYTITVTGALNWLVRSASEVEQNIVSVERILGYANLESEAADDVPDKKPPKTWPEDGTIEFDNYSMRYRPELELVLKDISLTVKGGERVGVCGRTGAGKSSLTLAVFRILEAASGRILIDGVDVSTIGLHDLRSIISIIPQDPQLFEGTLRNNIDPTDAASDAEIWRALEQSYLKEHVTSNMGGSLDAEIAEGGSNLSSGQRQLVCFARALLRKTKILVLDEATSSIDLETDEAVQQILRGPDFAGVTTLTIAHRLNTVIDSDRVLVMSDGQVAEFDTPEALLSREGSIFRSLAEEAGLGSAD